MGMVIFDWEASESRQRLSLVDCRSQRGQRRRPPANTSSILEMSGKHYQGLFRFEYVFQESLDSLSCSASSSLDFLNMHDLRDTKSVMMGCHVCHIF